MFLLLPENKIPIQYIFTFIFPWLTLHPFILILDCSPSFWLWVNWSLSQLTLNKMHDELIGCHGTIFGDANMLIG